MQGSLRFMPCFVYNALYTLTTQETDDKQVVNFDCITDNIYYLILSNIHVATLCTEEKLADAWLSFILEHNVVEVALPSFPAGRQLYLIWWKKMLIWF